LSRIRLAPTKLSWKFFVSATLTNSLHFAAGPILLAMASIIDLRHESLRILLVGSGGREHALAWKLSQSELVEQIFVVPGNGGTEAGLSKVSNITDVPADGYPGLVALARNLKANLVVPGPDAPVVDGIEGYFRAGI
jgi:hypothetical protein